MAFDGTDPTPALADAVALYEAGDFRAALAAFRALAEGRDGVGDEASIPAALFYLGRMAQRGEGQARDPRAAARWYRAAAERGEFRAQHNLSLAYETGDGVPRDGAQAIAWMRRAAEQGSARSQAAYAWCLAHGRNVERDLAAAVAWYRAAAEQGEPLGMVGLADALRAGVGIAQDLGAALGWYRAAAELDHADGQYGLADMLAEGQGGTRDLVEAARWFARAADAGHVHAQHAMGHACLNAHGVRQDFGAAFGWFRRAADQGFAPAQHSLGFMLLVGEGMPAEPAAALAWMRLAAEQGHPRAQRLLGLMRRDGIGAPADPVEAWSWFDRAATGARAFADGETEAGAIADRDAVEADLLPGQRAEAEARVRAWKPRSREQSANRAKLAAARAWDLADQALTAGRGRAPDEAEPEAFGDSHIFRQDPVAAAARVQAALDVAARDPHAALRHFDEAMRLDYQAVLDDGAALAGRIHLMRAAGQDGPERAVRLYEIGIRLSELRRWPEATVAYQAAGDLDPLFAWPFNNLAWMLATAEQLRAHDGPLAVTYAVRACDIAGWRYWPFLGTLAAALARCGAFDRAAQWQELALTLAPEKEKPEQRAMLEAFQQGQAWIDTSRTPAAGGAHASEEELADTDVEALIEEARGLVGERGVVVQ